MQSVAFETLGCKLNFSETSSIRREFSGAGYRVVDFEEKADIYVINTCSVTMDANRTCRKTVRRALRRNPDAYVAVVGCYAQLEPEEIAEIEGVDLVLGAKEKFRLMSLLDDYVREEGPIIHRSDVNEAVDFHHAFSSEDRTRAFLKVQDGCNYKCSFCTIPGARGRSRSPKIASVVENARILVDEGYREIVVTGVNAGDFGNGDETFFDLLKALDGVEGLQRIRVSSIEPNLLHEEIIRLAAHSRRIQPHFHIPLQSGCDEMLRLMRRRYRTELYRERVALIRRLIPDAAIGADLITGHPGETQQRFDRTLEFVRELDLSYLHLFTYSERPGTRALKLGPVVPHSERKRRTRILREVSKEKQLAFSLRHTGTLRPVLFESGQRDGIIEGWSDNYIRVSLPWRRSLENRILPVRLRQVDADGRFLGALDPSHENEERVIAALTA